MASGPWSEWPGSWTVHGLPRSHWHCQLDNFQWEEARPHPGFRTAVLEFLRGVAEDRGPHLLLSGKHGRGKSHVGVGVYRAVVHRFGAREAAWVNVPDFCDRAKKSYGGADADPFDAYREARRLVVLDDILGRDYTAHEVGQLLYRLIDLAYMNDAAVLVTMNHPIEALSQHFRPHEVSRLLQGLVHVPVQGRDWRPGGGS